MLCWCRKPLHTSLDYARVCKVVLSSFRNFCCLTRDGEFRYPHVVIQGIITHPVHCLHDGSKFLQPVIWHVFGPFAYHSLGVDPHACCETWILTQFCSSHPPILSITDIALENSAFVWMGIFQIESVIHDGLPELPHHSYSLVHLALSLNSAFGHTRQVLSSNRIFLVLPCFSCQRRDSVRLSSNHRSREQMPEHD